MTRRLLCVLLLAAACTKKEGDANPNEGAGEAKVQVVVGAQVAEVSVGRFVETVDAVGVVTPRMGHVATLAAPAPTRVARVFVNVGARVSAGDPLVEFELAPFEAALRSAETTLATAEKTAERALRLAEAGVLPRKDADAAASEAAMARSNAVTARRSRELATMRAPIAGVVTRMNAVLQGGADPSQPLVEIADPSVVDIVLSLSPSDAGRVRSGMAVAIYSGAAAAGTAVAHGRVADVAAAVDSTSRGVATRVAVGDFARPLRLGETLFGRVGVAEHTRAIMVPLESLVPDGEGFRVFVVDSAGVAHAHPVTVGARADTRAWIREGLSAGDRVVTHGAYGIDDSAKVVTGKP